MRACEFHKVCKKCDSKPWLLILKSHIQVANFESPPQFESRWFQVGFQQVDVDISIYFRVEKVNGPCIIAEDENTDSQGLQ